MLKEESYIVICNSLKIVSSVTPNGTENIETKWYSPAPWIPLMKIVKCNKMSIPPAQIRTKSGKPSKRDSAVCLLLLNAVRYGVAFKYFLV